MNKHLIFMVLLSMMFYFANIPALAQDAKSCEQVRKAVNFYCQKKYKKAISTLVEFRKMYPDHSLSEEALYAEGVAYFEWGKLKKAEKIFQELVAIKKYRDFDTSQEIAGCVTIDKLCNRFMIQENLLVLQHEACIKLAEIGFKTKNNFLIYESIVNADKYYRFWYGCGTGDMEQSMRISLLYSRYYELVGVPDSAIRVMLKYALEPAALPVPYYTDVVNRLVSLMKQKYQPADIKKMLDEAIDSISIEIFIPRPNKSNRIYSINLLGVKIQVAPVYLFAGNKNPEEVKEYIKKTDFYQKLTN